MGKIKSSPRSMTDFTQKFFSNLMRDLHHEFRQELDAAGIYSIIPIFCPTKILLQIEVLKSDRPDLVEEIQAKFLHRLPRPHEDYVWRVSTGQSSTRPPTLSETYFPKSPSREYMKCCTRREFEMTTAASQVKVAPRILSSTVSHHSTSEGGSHVCMKLERLDLSMEDLRDRTPYRGQIMDLVRTLHRAELVHRDLEARHVVISDDQVRLVDFAKAKRFDEMDTQQRDAAIKADLDSVDYMCQEVSFDHYVELLRGTHECLSDYQDELQPGEELPSFEQILGDLLVARWSEHDAPNLLLKQDPDLRKCFDQYFLNHQTHVVAKELWRGTTVAKYLHLQVGDLVPLTDRYTSWSTTRETALLFINAKLPVFFAMSTPDGIIGLDLTKGGLNENEVVLAPRTLVVRRIEKVNNVGIIAIVETWGE